MLNDQKDQLFHLIKSLTKAEKRNFKLYAGRNNSSDDLKFVQLFDALDKSNEVDDDYLIKRLDNLTRAQLANLKRHLFKQILSSLRLLFVQKEIDIQIREQIDFARILYGKGMYMQSLKLLESIKKIALEHHQDIQHLEILEFQKMIESRHITRSRKVKNKMETLLTESYRRSFITHETSNLSNLNIQVQGWYIQYGHARSTSDITQFKSYFDRHSEAIRPVEHLTFFEKTNYYQIYVWYWYILLDFDQCAVYAEKWVYLFDHYPQMKQKDPDLYMRSLYYLLTFCYLNKNEKVFAGYLRSFENFVGENQETFNHNSEAIAFVYLNLCKFNYLFLLKDYENGIHFAKDLLKTIPEFEGRTDPHRILLFYYKIAYLNFVKGHFSESINYLNEILNQKGLSLRQDLFQNARLLQIICHFEMGNFALVEYLSDSLSRSLGKTKDISKVQSEAAPFIKKLCKATVAERNDLFHTYHKRLQKLSLDPFERKFTMYLNLPLWVESKLSKMTVAHYYSSVKQ